MASSGGAVEPGRESGATSEARLGMLEVVARGWGVTRLSYESPGKTAEEMVPGENSSSSCAKARWGARWYAVLYPSCGVVGSESGKASDCDER